jgi:4-diphosphocytidyl-2-C-methyl-D-erythritol kinase
VSERLAHAKVNLALVVGPLRADGKHEVTTVLQRVGLSDRLWLEPAGALAVEGFPEDTLIRRSLELVGGSSDAAAALLLANETLDRPLARAQLSELASRLGADVPFFLEEGPQLGEGDGTILTRLELTQQFSTLLLLPAGGAKASTAAVYAAFDARSGGAGYDERRAALLSALSSGDLASLPPNDLASSPLADELRVLGAFRADVSGAGPAVYGLFADEQTAEAAAEQFDRRGQVWVAPQAW